MSYAAELFINRVKDMGAEIQGDDLVWPDGRLERITDPNYWAHHSEIQHKLKGEHAVFGAFGEVYWVKD